MKTFTKLTLIAASALSLAAGAASAQGWGGRDDFRWDDRGSIAGRQAALEGRIDAGMRSGRLTRQEAWRLRADFRDIARRADAYRANGVTGWERADLDRRFDQLSQRIRVEARDDERYGYGYGRDYRDHNRDDYRNDYRR
jgi:CubicO group peptidase (beta-lactamase class C family)